MTSPFKTVPETSVTLHEKAVMCLTQETQVLEKVQSSMTYGTAGLEFNVNEYILNKVSLYIFIYKYIKQI